MTSNYDYDIIVIGGGPSGISAAKKASELGKKTLLLERDSRLGGILNQCIHNGFGLKLFNEELTGPEYANKLASTLNNDSLTISLNTFVTGINGHTVSFIHSTEAKDVSSKAIILASGCRERTAGAISLIGTRPSGVYTAGFAQKMINHYGRLPGKKAVILGSGDIGLIMARRLTFEGVKVEGVFEIMKTSSGLQRNIKQCVEDFDIPLHFSTTITEIVGNDRVEGVYYSKVDENLTPIKQTERFLPCDCVLLSVGLIPETELIEEFTHKAKKTNGAIVDENRMTEKDGIFSCGNCLHIHDLADNASLEGSIAGESASKYCDNLLSLSLKKEILAGNGISYCLPQVYHTTKDSDFSVFFRATEKFNLARVEISQNNKIISTQFIRGVNPGEMQEIKIKGLDLSSDLIINMFEGVKKNEE